MRHRLEQRSRQARRQRNAQPIAITRGIFGGNQALFAGDAQLQQSPRANQPVDLIRATLAKPRAAPVFARKIAQPQAEIVNAVGRARAIILRKALRRLFHFGDGVGIEQLAQIGLAQQLAQLILIDGERLGAALGQRRIAVVEKIGHVAEQQRRGKRRRLARLHHMHAQLPLLNGAQRFNQRRHVENVAQALAIGLEQQRERGIARGHAEQIVRALAQLPQRRALVGAAARQQQRAARGLAKAPGKQRRRSQLAQHKLHGFGRLHQNPIRIGRLVGVGEAQHKAVVAPQRFHFRPAGGANARAHRHGPGNMDAAAERREHADAPVAQLVAAALDDNRAVVGNLPRRFGLVGEKAQQIFRRAGIEIVFVDEARERSRLRQGAQLAHHGADAAAEFERAARPVAFPERHLAGLAGSGRHQHAVVRDVGDAPRGRAEDESLVGMRLEDHLLVELAHAHRFALGEGEKDAVEAAVGNGSGVENRQPRRAIARRDHVAHAIPRQPRAQLAKLVGGVAAAEQIEHALEGRARKRAERRRAAHQIEEKIDGDFGSSVVSGVGGVRDLADVSKSKPGRAADL